MVTTVLLVDASAHTSELFAEAIRSRLGYEVVTLSDPATTVDDLDHLGHLGHLGHLDDLGHRPVDVAIVDVAFGEPPRTGLDVLVDLRRRFPTTALIAMTQSDGRDADLLREAWELLPLATVIDASISVATQLEQIRRVVTHGTAEPDPLTRRLLPATLNPDRTAESFARLVQHRGHAKLWAAILGCGPRAEYQELADASGLRVNALRNYRAQLLPELELHGLHNPPMRDLYAFATRCRPFLAPYIEAKGIRLG